MPKAKLSSANASKRSSSSNQLRIIAGQWRGRKLSVAEVPGLRPTGDRIRETLFNWLMAELPGSYCLDLFAGSGALGLECLSRGAKKVILIEQHPTVAKQLHHHCRELNATDAEVVTNDAIVWLEKTHQAKHSIDIVFIDPPFAEDLWTKAIEALITSELLAINASIYIETPKAITVPTPEDWNLHREKNAGDVSYRLYSVNSQYNLR